MGRTSKMNVSLTPDELRLVRQRVRAGEFRSESELVRESLRLLFQTSTSARTAKSRVRNRSRPLNRRLAAAYKASAHHDRHIAREWAQLGDAWPAK